MSSAAEFLADLQALGVKVWAEEGRLRYRSSPGVVTAEIRAELARHKQAILSLQQFSGSLSPGAVIAPRVLRSAESPLSFAQQRLWFLDRMSPGNASYNFHAAFRLNGPLNAEVLRRVFEEVVRRHESLRTTFIDRRGDAVAIAQEPARWDLSVTDLRSFAEEERESSALKLATREAELAFDLETGPLLRTKLLRLRDQEYVLLVTMHHIVCDRWSVAVLVREAGELYRAFVAGLPSPLPPARIQYADFADWQRTNPDALLHRDSLEYWRRNLEGIGSLDLTADRARPPVQSFAGGQVRFEIPRDLSDELRELSRRQGATLFMVLMSAFQVLLSRYSGQEDIAVGVPVANRVPAETETVIGLFVNSLVIRSNLYGNPSFQELLEGVRAQALRAFEHQGVQFERLVDELRVRRDPSRTPLFQVMFMLQEPYEDALDLPDIRAARFPVPTSVAKFDLTLEVTNTPALTGVLEYRTDLYDEATVARMADHYRNLLAAAAANPNTRIGELAILDEEERRWITEFASGEPVATPELPWVHSVFEMHALRTPHRLAVACNGSRWSYGTLNANANRLAHHLRALGVGPETKVGIFQRRSAAMLTSLLAVHKAGGAFVPLDPALPAYRLGFILRDADIGVVLSDSDLAERLAFIGVKVVLPETAADDSDMDPEPLAAAGNLAYVLYTSGSTGEPKGVEIPHSGLTNYLRWCQQRYFGQQGDGSAVHTPLGFDLTLTSLLAPLAAGESVTLPPESPAGRDWLELVEHDAHFGVLKLTPGHLRMLAQSTVHCRADLLVVGGEALCGEDVQDIANVMPDALVVNEYGPTEAVVGCAVESFRVADATSGPLPIGHPIQNARLYVLDRDGGICPVGVPGELHIGGVGVARGYLNRRSMTAERFLPDPYSGVPGARMFRSGDIARLRADGKLEYLGRRDRQVKIRGHRVELGEVEDALRRCEGVGAAAVMVRSERLVAYVAPGPEWNLEAAALRRGMAELVPEYMLPSVIEVLEELPLNRNGKVDLSVLPEPSSRPSVASPAGDNPLRQRIAAIWCDVLRRDQVDERTNFFDLGGDSLSILRVHSRIREALGSAPPLIELFRHPTVEALAGLIESQSSVTAVAPKDNRAQVRLERPRPVRHMKSTSTSG